MARRLSRDAAAKAAQTTEGIKGEKLDGATEASEIQKGERTDGALTLGRGSVEFLELDAETMGEYFSSQGLDGEGKRFDVVWITEALSHFPDKPLCFRNAYTVLAKGGKLVIADWFKAEGLGREEVEGDIKPIEGTYANSHSFLSFRECRVSSGLVLDYRKDIATRKRIYTKHG